jgi:hypothetical protein
VKLVGSKSRRPKNQIRSSDQAKKTDPHAVGHDRGERVVSHPEKCAIAAVEKPYNVDRREDNSQKRRHNLEGPCLAQDWPAAKTDIGDRDEQEVEQIGPEDVADGELVAAQFAMLPRTLLSASDALPLSAAVAVVASSGSDVTPPRRRKPAKARPMPALTAIASAK